MRKYLNYLLIIFLISSCTTGSSSQPEIVDATSSSVTSVIETTSTTSTIKIDEESFFEGNTKRDTAINPRTCYFCLYVLALIAVSRVVL